MWYLVRDRVVIDRSEGEPEKLTELPEDLPEEELLGEKKWLVHFERWIESEESVEIGMEYDLKNKSFSWTAYAKRNYELACSRRREERNLYLRNTDYCVLQAVESEKKMCVMMKKYRQALRDISKQSGFPFNIQWPVME